MLPIILIMLALGCLSLGAIAVSGTRISRGVAVIYSALAVALSIISMLYALAGNPLVESYPYLSYIGISLSFSMTGISVVLMVMASIVLLAAALSANPEREGVRLSSAMIVLFGMAALGLFSSANLFLFFIFWDLGVISMFIMINVLGSANRRAASINFLIYEIFASSMLLLAILLLYAYTPLHSLSIPYLQAAAGSLPRGIKYAVFILLFLAFMTNMPLFPMHHWLPDAHTEASTQGSMLLSGVLTKFGGFGMIVLFTIIPLSQHYAIYVAALASVSAIYGALVMLGQTDLKRIIAYSTIVEMGVVMVAISASNPLATAGAVYGMLSHGLVVALMFLAVGMVKHIFKERNINRLRGILSSARTTTYMFMVGTLAMVGLPLTSGFIADLLIFIGSVQTFGIYGAIPLFSVLIMGAYMYSILGKSFLSSSETTESLDYIGIEQYLGYYLIAGAIVIFGVLPFIVSGALRI